MKQLEKDPPGKEKKIMGAANAGKQAASTGTSMKPPSYAMDKYYWIMKMKTS